MKLSHDLNKVLPNVFSTKLSLPKFISVLKSLTPAQRSLVINIGFQGLLDIQCDTVPRGICIWIAKHFDVKTRTIILPNGFSLKITPFHIHQVLGIPFGGKVIDKKCDDSLKKWVATETRCKGSTPSINELKSLFTDDLDDDKFKLVFTLFAICSLLCPTSYECISPEYNSAVAVADDIQSYDWCGAVLDKITQSIQFYQSTQGSNSIPALGGCILALVIIYFELLDAPAHNDIQTVPRLKFWSTDMVKAIETLDAIDIQHCVFGRLQIKDLRKTPFWVPDMHSVVTEEQTQTCPDCCPKDKNLRAQVTNLFDDFQKEIVKAVQPVVSLYSSRMHTLWHSFQKSLDNSSVTPNCRSISNADISDLPKREGIAEIDISVEDDQSRSVQPPSADSFHNSNLVDAAAGKCKATPDEATTSEGLGGILCTKTFAAAAASEQMTKDQSSSFLEVPSFSQDSSKSSNHTVSHDGHEFQAKSADLTRGSSDKLPSALKPETHGTRAADVFPSQKKSILKNSQTVDTKTVGDSDRAALEGTATVATIEDFVFWGNGTGFDSDFEVKSPSEASGTAKKDQDLPNAAKRRWPPSLNEAALYSIESAKKKREQAVSHCAQKTSSEGHLVLEGTSSCQKQLHSDSQQHNEDTELPTTPIGAAAIIGEDEAFDTMPIDQLNQLLQLTPTTKVKELHYNFSSSLVEKEVFEDIVSRIPFSGPRPRIVEINKYWVDHKTFGLSMRVAGAVSKHVIDLMGQAVMADQTEKIESNLLSKEAWYRHVVTYERACML